MSKKQPKNILLESIFVSQKKQFLNILKRINYRCQHQSSLHLNIDRKMDYTQVTSPDRPENSSLFTHASSGLLKEHRKSTLVQRRNRRNGYNVYPLLEKQGMEKNQLQHQIPNKCEVTNLSPKQKASANLKQNDRLPKLKELTFSVQEVPVFKRIRREDQRKSNTVLCCVSKLNNTLKVNKKILNGVQIQKLPQSFQHAKQTKAIKKNETKYSFYIKNRPVVCEQKLTTFYKCSKHDPTPVNDLTCWNSEEDDTNSFQNHIF